MGRVVALALLLLAGPGAFAEPPDRPPDPALVRVEVDRTLAVEAPTLGRIAEAANLSIAFGAPAYNAGDIEGCRDFYLRTMAKIVDQWGGADDTDPATAEALAVLAGALARARSLEGVDRQAWALRYGWDRVALAHATEMVALRGLVGIGSETLARGQYPEAAEAFAAAAEKVEQLAGSQARSIEVDLRFAALAEGHARLGTGEHAAAADATARGLALVPEWLTFGVDPGAIHPAGDHERLLVALEIAAAEEPEALDLQFLLAYHYAMLGRKKEAEKLVKKVLKQDDEHLGARLLSGALAAR